MGARLRFAIAAAKSHDVLLVDEALATGDAEFRVKSHARIEELREQAGTVFLVAHNLEEVEETCNRVIWMERGRMVMEGDDVTGIIDQYIAASGGQPVMRDPETGHRLGGRQHAARNLDATTAKNPAARKEPPAGDQQAAKDQAAAKKEPAARARK
jgi:ABC-type multidrug transport system ATPase subunit